MKKLIPTIICATILNIVGCSSYDDEQILSSYISNTTCSLKTKGRSIDEAIQIVNEALGTIDKNSRAQTRSFDVSKVKIKTVGNSRSISLDTLYYVFNFDGGNGFAIVAYNRRAEGLLAITESGQYQPSEITGIGGFDAYMATAENYLSNLNNELDFRVDSLLPNDSNKTIDIGDTIPDDPKKDLVEYKYEKKNTETMDY